ncbi:MAG: YhdP family protein [Gallionella sp.]|nr:YhdP family protein [Gallionella sp.]
MLKPALRHTARGAKRLWRLAIRLGILLALIGAAALLVLRHIILPDIERYHAGIVSASSAALGRTVEIGRIEADWNGLRPRLLLSNVRVLDALGQVAVELPRLYNTVAWTTLIAGELRFHSLELESPDLLIRRDPQGRLFIAGVSSGGQAGVKSDAGTSDWWLRHSNIIVHAGHVVWQDEMRSAPPLEFNDVELRILNRGERHRFALRSFVATTRASRIDLRGDLYGNSFTDLGQWQGEIFARIDEIDVVDWSKWFNLPEAIQSGSGGMRVWLGVVQGNINRVDADVDLHDFSAKLAEDLPRLDMPSIRGRLAWRQSDKGLAVSTHGLALRMRDGFELKPTNLTVQYSPKQGYRSASGEVSVNALDLADVNTLLAYLPVEAGLRRRLLDLAPRGKVNDLHASWQGDLERLAQYRVQARFTDIGVSQVGAFPGFSGVSGEVAGSDRAGTLTLNSRDLKVLAPDFMAEMLVFDQVDARLDWQRNGRGWELKLNDTHVRNDDLEGTVSGGYQVDDGPGIADITINLKHASVKHAARYIPMHAFDDATYRWLQTGLQEGDADSFLMRVRGDLRNFPFPDSKDGLFKIEAKAKDVAIEFDTGWPRIERAQTNLLIQGRRLEVHASKAMTSGAALRKVKVVLPDTLADALVMEVDGEAADTTQHCLDYIRKSPVSGYLDGYTDGFRTVGDGLLKLRLDIPMSGEQPVKLIGSYRFSNNEVDLGEHVPLLKNATGELSFTNDSLQANNMQAQILGGSARISLKSENGILLTQASGKLDADSLPKTYSYPLLRRLHGTAEWTTEVRVKNRLADVVVTSDLQGLSSELPLPFGKTSSEKKLLRFEQRDINSKNDVISLRYAEVISADLMRTAVATGKWDIRRGAIAFGKARKNPRSEGIWISGDIPEFALEGWNGWSDLPNREGVLPNIANIDLAVGKVQGFGNTIHQLNISGSGRNGLISTRLASREVNGDLIWQPQGQGRLLVRLKNAMLGEGGSESVSPATGPAKATAVKEAGGLPEIDVAIEKLTWKGRQLGRLEMLLNGEGDDVVMQSLRLTNPDGVFSATGKWSAATDRTQINARLDISNAGKIMARSGYPEGLKDGNGSLEFDLNWNGSPDAFNYGSLDGTLRLKTGKGRFLQVNPGAAKLLGVLSLQSLPKRISLDFTDVISPGFEFDSITGEASIEHGLLKTNDFRMTGAAARITLNGQVDLERETQNLKVRVLPTIGDNVSLLSFAAGPAVGVSVLLANKILRDPLDKLVAFDYNVSGSWANPKVERLGQSKAQP